MERITLAGVVFASVITVLLICGALMIRDTIASSRLLSQVSQIGHFDSAVAAFHEKYEGLPGDLISIKAQREGLPFGDGTPSHSDGDGKISPCYPGWQWNLGCETALFWAQLSAAGLVPEDYKSNNQYFDSLLAATSSIAPFLPKAALADNLYITVWNSDIAQPSPGRPLPFGNYYEISKITGIAHGKLKDDDHALTPLQAKLIDEKIDDGYPYSGRVMANGAAEWPNEAWGSFARPGKNRCVSSDKVYNVDDNPATPHLPLCHIAVALECCGSANE